MSKFVLTAQLQLQAPANVRQVVNQIQQQLNGVSVNVNIQGASQAAKQLNQITQSANNAGSAATKMGNAFGVSLKRFAAFSLASRAIGLFTNKLSQAIDDAIDFQNEMVKLSQITGDSTEKLGKLANRIGDLAITFGVSSKEIISVTNILAQAGLKAKDLDVAIKVLTKTKLAPTFGDIKQTAEGVVAILAQFGEGTAALERQLGAINKVAAEFAVESEDLIDVVRRTGGVFKASGGQLEELLALFTSVRATTRESAESIATGLRTIFTRIQRPETIRYLKQFGVELTNLNGKFVGPYEAVKRLSQALSGLGEGDIRFVQIAEELGGFRQIGKVIPLLQQFTIAEQARQTALSAGASLDEDAAKAQESLLVQFTKVREEFLRLVREIADTTSFKVLVKSTLSLASALISVASALKPIIPLVAAFAAIKFTQNIGNFFGGLGSALGVGKKNLGGKIQAFASGGMVPGSGNRDTVPAMLTPGEFVIRKSSVKKLGADRLAAMNNNKYAFGGQARRFGVASLLPMGQSLEEINASISTSDIRNILAKKTGGKDVIKKGNLINADNMIRSILGLKGKSPTIKTSAVAETISQQDVAQEIDKKVQESIKGLIDNAAESLGSKLKIPVQGKANEDILKSVGTASTVGSIFEGALGLLGTPKNITSGEQDPIDFPQGLGSDLEKVFSSLAGIPVDAKRTATKKILKDVATRKASSYLANAIYTDSRWQSFMSKDVDQGKNINLKEKLSSVFKGKEVSLADIKKKFPYITKDTLKDLGFDRKYNKYQFATGGSIAGSDTVPAMLTPGEFVINKQAASRIGYGNLNRMNKQGVAGFATGGAVGVKKFATGGTASPTTAASKESFASVGLFIAAVTGATMTLKQFVTAGSAVDRVIDKIGQLASTMAILNSATKGLLATKIAEGVSTTNFIKIFTTKAGGLGDLIAGIQKTKGGTTRQAGASFREQFKYGKMSEKEKQAAIAPITTQVEDARKNDFSEAIQQRREERKKIRTAANERRAKIDADTSLSDDEKKQEIKRINRIEKGKLKKLNISTRQKLGLSVDPKTGLPLASDKDTDATTIKNLISPRKGAQKQISKLLTQRNVITGTQAPTSLLGGIGRSLGNVAGGGGPGAGIARLVGGGLSRLGGLAGLGGGGAVGGLMSSLTALAGPLAAAGALVYGFNEVIGAAVDYTGKFNDAIEKAGTETDPGKEAANMQNIMALSVQKEVPALIGVFGEGAAKSWLGFMENFGGKSATFYQENARALALSTKYQAQFAKNAQKASDALEDIQAGRRTATEALQSGDLTANLMNAAEAQKATAKAAEENLKGKSEGGYATARNILSLGGTLFENAGMKNRRLEKESRDMNIEAAKATEKDFQDFRQTGLKAVTQDVLSRGGNVQDVLNQLSAKRKDAAGRVVGPSVMEQLSPEQQKRLKQDIENQSKAYEENIKYLKALNFGMREINATAKATTLALENLSAGTESGFNAFEQSIAVLESSVTNVATKMNPADIEAAQKTLADTLRGYGADETQVKRATNSLAGLNKAQNGASKALEQLKGDVKSGISGNQLRDNFNKYLSQNLEGVDEETKKRITDAMGGVNLGDPKIMEQLISGNLDPILEQALGPLAEAFKEQTLGPLRERAKQEKILIDLTRKRIDLEKTAAESTKRSIEITLEADKAIQEFGGPVVTAKNEINALNKQLNVDLGLAGIAGVGAGRPEDLKFAQQQIQSQFTALQQKQNTAVATKGVGGFAGVAGVEQDKRQQLQQAQQNLLDITKKRLDIARKEIALAEKKNELEKSAIDKLLGGDIEGYIREQQAAAAGVALQLGDTSLANMFGAGALGGAMKNLEEQMKMGGISKEQFFQASRTATSSLGVGGPAAERMAGVYAGRTPEQLAIEQEAQQIAELQKEIGKGLAEMDMMQVQAQEVIINAANVKMQNTTGAAQTSNLTRGTINAPTPVAGPLPFKFGGLVYANRGIFIPRGTDTVPAMLTPGEFVVNRQAVQTGNNLQILRAINSGANAKNSGNGEATTMNRGGRVGYYSNGGVATGMNDNVLNTLNSIFTGFSDTVNKLQNMQLSVKLDATNVNVNFNGTSFLANLTDTIKSEVLSAVQREIPNIKTNNAGQSYRDTSTLA